MFKWFKKIKADEDLELEDFDDLVFDSREALFDDINNQALDEEDADDGYAETSRRFREKYSQEKEEVNLKGFSREEVNRYIQNQCEIMEETIKQVVTLKEEYSTVNSYFSDIQIIESAPKHIGDKITEYASKIMNLTVDRRIFQNTESKLSNNRYSKMEELEPSMPKALVDLQNDEAYFNTVKKDMKLLEGERMSIRYDAKDLVQRQRTIRKISQLASVCLICVFVICIFAAIKLDNEIQDIFLLILLLAGVLASGLFGLTKYTERQVRVTEIKLNKAIGLLNKVKIKYINAANTLDYEYAKYDVKNSYELSVDYEAYLEMKSERKKITEMTSALNDSEQQLISLLDMLNLYDKHIWLSQLKALTDSREMVEVRHKLTVRRQKLRMQIDYNKSKLDESKANIKKIIVYYPKYKQEVLDIVEKYEIRNEY